MRCVCEGERERGREKDGQERVKERGGEREKERNSIVKLYIAQL